MKKWWIYALFLGLVLVYFRNTLFVPANYLITRHEGTDLYIYFLHSIDFLKWLKQGFIPIGNYWVPHGGGFPATPLDQLAAPSYLMLLGVYSITHNALIALRIVYPIFYFLTLVTTYWYGLTLLKKTGPAIIIAIAYAFSMYGVMQLEHIDLLGAMFIIPLALVFLEKTLASHKAKYVILTSFAMALVYLTHLYAFYFMALFVVLRFGYELIRNSQRRRVIVSGLKIAVIFIIAVLPFFILQLGSIPTPAEKADLTKGLYNYAEPPGLFFSRSAPTYATSDNSTMYFGIFVVVLALLPTLLKKTPKDYVFYLIGSAVFIFYAIGHFSPINIAQFMHNYVPLTFFVRVPGRALLIGYLLIAVCAGIGLLILIQHFKKWPQLVTGVAIVLVFCDLTIGYEPPTIPMPIPVTGAYEWLSKQSGDFRIEEIPSISNQIAVADMDTDHETYSWERWGYDYYSPLYAATDLYQQYLNNTASAGEAAFYGVKYILLNTDPSYYVKLAQPLSDIEGQDGVYSVTQIRRVENNLNASTNYKLVYQDSNEEIYQNLQYHGLVFEENPGNATITYTNPNPNTFDITVDTSQPTNIVVSQSFDKGWTTTTGMLTSLNSMQCISVPAGHSYIVLHYTAYEKSLLWFLVYIPLLGLIVWLLLRKEIRQ